MAPLVVVAMSLLCLMPGNAHAGMLRGERGVQHLVASSTSSSSIPRKLQASTCSDNQIAYGVNLDIQADFSSGQAVDCNANEEGTIESTIVSTLNSKFASTVSDWEGVVGFGPISFDASQTVDNTGRRALQEADRRLQSTCPQRSFPCESDYCRWGCLVAPATNCGVSSLTNWAALEDDVLAALKGLGYGCLGDKDKLVVNMLVEDPNQGAANATRSEGSDAFMNQLLGFSGSGKDATSNNPSTPDLTGCKDLEVNAHMRFEFFKGTGTMPLAEEVASLVSDTQTFFQEQLELHDAFKANVCAVLLSQVVPVYNSNADSDLLEVNFLIHSWVKEQVTADSAAALSILAASPFKEYIGEYLRVEGNELSEVFKVHFKGTASQGGEEAPAA